MDIFYYNTTIYKEILLKFLHSTEKYHGNRTPFHFRLRADAVLRHAACLRPSSPKKWFYTSIWAMLIEKSSGTPQHSTASKIGLRILPSYENISLKYWKNVIFQWGSITSGIFKSIFLWNILFQNYTLLYRFIFLEPLLI